jgi:hypothetical protein
MAGGAKQAGFLAWLVAFVVPPAVVGGLGQRFVAHHPGWAVMIGVAYEALVAVGAFLAVIARDVSSRWQVRIADRVDLSCSARRRATASSCSGICVSWTTRAWQP